MCVLALIFRNMSNFVLFATKVDIDKLYLYRVAPARYSNLTGIDEQWRPCDLKYVDFSEGGSTRKKPSKHGENSL